MLLQDFYHKEIQERGIVSLVSVKGSLRCKLTDLHDQYASPFMITMTCLEKKIDELTVLSLKSCTNV